MQRCARFRRRTTVASVTSAESCAIWTRSRNHTGPSASRSDISRPSSTNAERVAPQVTAEEEFFSNLRNTDGFFPLVVEGGGPPAQ